MSVVDVILWSHLKTLEFCIVISYRRKDWGICNTCLFRCLSLTILKPINIYCIELNHHDYLCLLHRCPLPCFVVKSNANGNYLTSYHFPWSQLRCVRLSIVSHQTTEVQVSCRIKHTTLQVSCRIKLPAQVETSQNLLSTCCSHGNWRGFSMKYASEVTWMSSWMLLEAHGCFCIGSDKVFMGLDVFLVETRYGDFKKMPRKKNEWAHACCLQLMDFCIESGKSVLQTLLWK